MAAFNPNAIKPASKSAEFAKGNNTRTAKDVLLAAIDNQLALYKDAKKEGRRWFQAGKTETLLSLRYSNRALVLKDGEKSVVVPNDQVEPALAYFRDQVVKDAYADQLTAMEAAGEQRKTKMRATRATKKAAKTA